jgi:hypothetical protein
VSTGVSAAAARSTVAAASARCEHGRQRKRCMDCGGCEHGRLLSSCKDCGHGGVTILESTEVEESDWDGAGAGAIRGQEQAHRPNSRARGCAALTGVLRGARQHTERGDKRGAHKGDVGMQRLYAVQPEGGTRLRRLRNACVRVRYAPADTRRSTAHLSGDWCWAVTVNMDGSRGGKRKYLINRWFMSAVFKSPPNQRSYRRRFSVSVPRRPRTPLLGTFSPLERVRIIR